MILSGGFTNIIFIGDLLPLHSGSGQEAGIGQFLPQGLG